MTEDTELTSLRARVAALEEALRPLVAHMKDNYSKQSDDFLIHMGASGYDLRWCVHLGDLRRARAALEDR